MEIERSIFDELWPQTEGRRIEKFRREIALDQGLTAEVDSYEAGLEGLVTVEVEFDSPEEANGFWPPDWFGRELTGDPAWANQTLAASGRPEKYLEYRLRPGEEPATGACRVVAARAAQAAGAVRAAGHSSDQASQVHEARKSLKKARSALRMLRGTIPDQERQSANSSCREAGRRMSAARDAEVKLATLVDITDRAETWRRELEAEATSHRNDLSPENLADIAKQVESVARSFRGRQEAGAGDRVIRNVARAYGRGRKSMRRARKQGDAEEFHSWRKRAKDLRYQLEILEPRLPDEFTDLRKSAEELADRLGDLHDLAVLAEDLTGRGLDPDERAELDGRIASARQQQVESCLELGAEVYEVKPRKFRRRLSRVLAGS